MRKATNSDVLSAVNTLKATLQADVAVLRNDIRHFSEWSKKIEARIGTVEEKINDQAGFQSRLVGASAVAALFVGGIISLIIFFLNKG